MTPEALPEERAVAGLVATFGGREQAPPIPIQCYSSEMDISNSSFDTVFEHDM